MTKYIVIDRKSSFALENGLKFALNQSVTKNSSLTVILKTLKSYKSIGNRFKNKSLYAILEKVINSSKPITYQNILIDRITMSELRCNYDESTTFSNKFVFIADIDVSSLDIFNLIDATSCVIANEITRAAQCPYKIDILDSFYKSEKIKKLYTN